MTNLNDNPEEILDGVFEGETETKEEAKKPEPEEKEETKGETEETKEKSEEETDAEPPAAKEEKLVPKAALHDERRKRQSLEEELKQYKTKYDVDEDAPDPADDPEGYKEHVRTKLAADMHQEKITASRNLAIEKHDDYVENEKTFMFLASHDQTLVEEMNKHPDPASFAYEKAQGYLKEQRSKIEAEILASAKSDEVKEEKVPTKSDERKASAVSVPDLTKAAAAGTNSEPAEIDNRDSLQSMF